jgi:hypothetical protein
MVVVTTATTFEQKLERGQIAEGLVARYLRKEGWCLLPVYEKQIDNGKGPRIFLPHGLPESELIAPDLLGMRGQQIQWIEAKSKGTATYYRIKQRWQTGCDKRHYENYKRVQAVTTWPVYLMFLQLDNAESNAPWGAPPCPTGLFCCPISHPPSDEGVYWRNGKPFPMVYWALSDLKKLASLKEVLA